MATLQRMMSSMTMKPHTTDTRPLLIVSAETAGDVIARITPDQFDNPTPCGEFNVRALLGHMHTVLRRVEAVGAGQEPMSVTEEVVTDLTDADLVAQWDIGVAATLATWTDGTHLDSTIVFPWVTHSGAATLIMYAAELTLHTWDLAKATNQTVAWSDAVLLASLGCNTALLPNPNRASQFDAIRNQMPPEFRDFPAPYADAVPVGDDASVIDRLVAWNGRKP
jgi:uncharacterized protein (TIGR03086 family)